MEPNPSSTREASSRTILARRGRGRERPPRGTKAAHGSGAVGGEGVARLLWTADRKAVRTPVISLTAGATAATAEFAGRCGGPRPICATEYTPAPRNETVTP